MLGMFCLQGKVQRRKWYYMPIKYILLPRSQFFTSCGCCKLQGEVQRQKWYYMPIKYTTARAVCNAWTTKPTYFLQVRYR